MFKSTAGHITNAAKKQLLLVVILLLVYAFASAQYNKPGLLLLNKNVLDSLKADYKTSKPATGNVRVIINRANAALRQGPFSVTFDVGAPPPGGDNHNYVSQGRYYWKSGRGAYIYRDGYTNPEINKYKDHDQLQSMINNATALSLAYFYTEDERYFNKAKELLQVWFINPATRMNPNLQYAQFIPGKNTGTASGVLDAERLVQLPDDVALLAFDGKLDNDPLKSQLQEWFSAFAAWMQQSSMGATERKAVNNHGTYYDLQLAVYSKFTGDDAVADNILNVSVPARIEEEFADDGSQPNESKREKSLSYSLYNLTAFVQLANLSRNTHNKTDLWVYKTKSGKSIQAGVALLVPYLKGEKTWKNAEKLNSSVIEGFRATLKHARNDGFQTGTQLFIKGDGLKQ